MHHAGTLISFSKIQMADGAHSQTWHAVFRPEYGQLIDKCIGLKCVITSYGFVSFGVNILQ